MCVCVCGAVCLRSWRCGREQCVLTMEPEEQQQQQQQQELEESMDPPAMDRTVKDATTDNNQHGVNSTDQENDAGPVDDDDDDDDDDIVGDDLMDVDIPLGPMAVPEKALKPPPEMKWDNGAIVDVLTLSLRAFDQDVVPVWKPTLAHNDTNAGSSEADNDGAESKPWKPAPLALPAWATN